MPLQLLRDEKHWTEEATRLQEEVEGISAAVARRREEQDAALKAANDRLQEKALQMESEIARLRKENMQIPPLQRGITRLTKDNEERQPIVKQMTEGESDEFEHALVDILRRARARAQGVSDHSKGGVASGGVSGHWAVLLQTNVAQE